MGWKLLHSFKNLESSVKGLHEELGTRHEIADRVARLDELRNLEDFR
jgi:hypothetical protein